MEFIAGVHWSIQRRAPRTKSAMDFVNCWYAPKLCRHDWIVGRSLRSHKVVKFITHNTSK